MLQSSTERELPSETNHSKFWKRERDRGFVHRTTSTALNDSRIYPEQKRGTDDDDDTDKDRTDAIYSDHLPCLLFIYILKSVLEKVFSVALFPTFSGFVGFVHLCQ